MDGSPSEHAGFFPGIGRSRRWEDVAYAFGHGHVGMAASLMIRKVVNEITSDQNTNIDIASFNRARFI